jgi:branched-chain amino acid transport system substrate-binding protein
LDADNECAGMSRNFARNGETTMKIEIVSIVSAALLLMTPAPAAQAAAPYRISVIQSLTGGAAFLGQAEQKSLQIAEKMVNASGGIQGRPLKFVFYDDQSTPQIAVQLANEVIATHPAVVLGSSLVAMCKAMAPLMKNGPVMYCLSPGIYPPKGGYVFTTNVSTYDLTTALIRYFRTKGWTRLALITSTDATGQEAEEGMNTFLKDPENHDIVVVERNHFNTTDVSVSAQIERIKAAHPQALIAWTTGAQIATVLRGIVQGGIDVPVAISNGNMTYAQMKQYAGFLPKALYIPSSLWPASGSPRFALDPAVGAKQKAFHAAFAAAGMEPDNASVLAWDPAVIIVDALRKLGPQATAAELRSYLVGLQGQAGVNGIYDFAKVPQRGLAINDTLVTLWQPEKARWEVVSKATGLPLD